MQQEIKKYGTTWRNNMVISIISVFPEIFDSMQLSLLGKAQASELCGYRYLICRDWAHVADQWMILRPAEVQVW